MRNTSIFILMLHLIDTQRVSSPTEKKHQQQVELECWLLNYEALGEHASLSSLITIVKRLDSKLRNNIFSENDLLKKSYLIRKCSPRKLTHGSITKEYFKLRFVLLNRNGDTFSFSLDYNK